MATSRTKLVTFPERPVEPVDLPAALAALAASQRDLAAAVRQQAAITELLVETIPAATEAKFLGVSVCTVRRRREQRKNARLLQTTA